MKYITYSLKDFLEDDAFIKWVLSPTPESDFFWNSFMIEYPEKKETVEKAAYIVKALNKETREISDADVGTMKASILAEIKSTRNIDLQQEEIQSEGGGWAKAFIKIAAVVLMMIVSALLIYSFVNIRRERKVTWEERVNPNGQRSSMILPDGSKVWLNAGSSLRYLTDLGQSDQREVYLEGEGFFEVAKNKTKPFIVHANAIAVKVLGTSFNVKAYSNEETIETTLVEGKIAINEKTENLIMNPNQQAVFSKREKRIQLFEVDPQNTISWKEGRLVFEDESIQKVAGKLERWYGVEMRLEGDTQCSFTFKIGKESLKEVLETLKLATRLNYKMEGNKIYVNVLNCGNKIRK